MRSLYELINKIIVWCLILIFALLVIDVLLQVGSRYLLGQSFSFTEEFARFALIWLSVLGAAYLTGTNEHLSMDFLYSKLVGKKKVFATQIIQLLIALFAIVVMIIGGANLVYITLDLGQLSPALHLPLGYVYMIVPISGLLILYYCIYNILTASSKINSPIENTAI